MNSHRDAILFRCTATILQSSLLFRRIGEEMPNHRFRIPQSRGLARFIDFLSNRLDVFFSELDVQSGDVLLEVVDLFGACAGG